MSFWSRRVPLAVRRSPQVAARPDRRRSLRLTPGLEPLEAKRLLATITWDVADFPGGGDWNTAADWVGGKVPTKDDAAVINLTAAGTITHSQPSSDTVQSLTTSSFTTLSLTGGALNLGATTSSLGGPVLVGSGTALTVAAAGKITLTGNATTNPTINTGGSLTLGQSASLNISAGSTLVVAGALNLGSGDFVNLLQGYNAPAVLNINNGGVVSAANTGFLNSGSGYQAYSQINVNAGGQLKATGSTFTVTTLNFAGGAVLNTGDLASDNFASTVSVPAALLPALIASSNTNVSFGEVDIPAGTLAAGTTLGLNAAGLPGTTGLHYVLTGSFTIAAGATVNVAPNINLAVNAGTTLQVAGALNLGTGDNLSLVQGYNAPAQVTVAGGGLLTAGSGANFLNSGSGYQAYSQITVNGGGELRATNSHFTVTSLVFAAGATVNPGDLIGSTFDTTVTIAATTLPALIAPTNANFSFDDINILPDTLASGTTINLLNAGTGSTMNLRYVLNAASFTVAAGATLNVAANTKLVVSAGTTLTVAGALNLGSGASATLVQGYNAPAVLTIKGGGVVSAATNTSFLNSGSGYQAYSQINVNAGGELKAANSTFTVTTLNFADNAIVNLGDLTGGTFTTTVISIPAAALPALIAPANANLNFGEIDILPGTLPSGTTLNLLSPSTMTSLRYVFTGSTFTVATGGTLTVAPSAKLAINPGTTLAIAGALNLATGDSLTLTQGYNAPAQLAINNGGVVAAPSGVSFLNSGSGYQAYSQISINSGGQLTAVGDSIATTDLTVNSGGTLNLTRSQLATVFNVNSGATYSVAGNDFSGIGAKGVVASGDGNASIPLAGNYWGVTDPSAIAAKIVDHLSNAALPTVVYKPFLKATSGTVASSQTVSYAVAGQSVTLSATVSASNGTVVSEGTETFTIFNGTQVIGTTTAPVQVNNGAASAVFTLPASTAPGKYTIQASYSGSSNYGPAVDTSQFLTVNPALTTTTAKGVAVGYSPTATSTVTLQATVSSTGGAINEGTITFTVFSGGGTVIGAPLIVAVANGAAATSFTVPAGLAAGSYTIQATYSDPTDFSTSTDTSSALTVNPATTTASVAGASVAYSANASTVVTIRAQVDSSANPLNEGSVFFTIVNSQGVVVGATATTAVQAGLATANYTLPAGTAAGTYTIRVAFNGSRNYQSSSVATSSLTVTAVATTGNADPVSTTFRPTAQTVTLGATVSSASAPSISVGTVTFTIQAGANSITVGPVNVVNGRATTTATLPSGFAAGIYPIQVVYSGAGSLQGFTDSSATLTVGKSPSAIAADTTTVGTSATSQTITLGASVVGPGGQPITAPGSLTFQVLSGSTPVGSPVTADSTNGRATARYTLPAGLAAGTYTIVASFAGSGNYAAATDSSATLTVKVGAVVTATPTATTLTPSASATTLGRPVTLSVAVAPAPGTATPTGTVTFFDGATALGSVTLNSAGVATLSVPRFALGTHAITASYGGDSANAPSGASATSVYVTDLPLMDFDGDGKADLSVFGRDPTTGRYRFRVVTSSTHFNPAKAITFDNNGYGYGNAQSIPVPGDYFGEGVDAYALWTPTGSGAGVGNSGGMLLSLISSVTGKSVTATFGNTTDVPVVADVDGDGKADFGVYGYQAGLGYRFAFLLSSASFSSSSPLIFNNNGYGYGNAQSIPIVADLDGSGKAGFGLYIPGSPSTFVYVSSTGASFTRSFGTSADIPTVADLDGDGRADLVLFGPDPSKAGHSRFTALTSSTNFSTAQPIFFDNNGFGYGNSTSTPAVADYEGTGHADFALFLPDYSGGTEYVYQTGQTGNGVVVDLGGPSDIPLSTSPYLRAKKVRGS